MRRLAIIYPVHELSYMIFFHHFLSHLAVSVPFSCDAAVLDAELSLRPVLNADFIPLLEYRPSVDKIGFFVISLALRLVCSLWRNWIFLMI